MHADRPATRTWVIGALVIAVIAGTAASVAHSEAVARDTVHAPAAAWTTVAETGDSSAPAPVTVEADAPPVPLAPTAVVVADAAWTAHTAARTGIPSRALHAYATAALTVRAEQPSCGLGWNTLAGLGAVESGHGTHSGGILGADGYPDPPIRGIALDGHASERIADTDGGRWDGDATWDRAVGPLQFIPATWESWGADADGDGAADPNQIDDAALAAARYLCASGGMTDVEGWRRAVFSYNHLDSYVDEVAALATMYGDRARA